MKTKTKKVKQTKTKKCQWFLNCTREATTTAKHPILGDVPVCQKCKQFAGT